MPNGQDGGTLLASFSAKGSNNGRLRTWTLVKEISVGIQFAGCVPQFVGDIRKYIRALPHSDEHNHPVRLQFCGGEGESAGRILHCRKYYLSIFFHFFVRKIVVRRAIESRTRLSLKLLSDFNVSDANVNAEA